MKATGIVRRIDDLGRVVIPKEIRRVLRIKEGDPLEIFTDHEGEVIFKKYSPIGELGNIASQYAETLHKTCAMSVVICDRNSVIAFSGVPKKEYADKSLSAELEKIIESRTVYTHESEKEMIFVTPESSEHFISCAMPIISEGDIAGCVVSLTSSSGERTLDSDLEKKLVMTAASFLSKQLEG